VGQAAASADQKEFQEEFVYSFTFSDISDAGILMTFFT
jgi:hypothetical protein